MNTHEIHTSEIRSFLGCRRRWHWAYRERIVPETSPKPLEFGIAFHIALEVFYDPITWSQTTPKEKTQRAIEAFVSECERQRNEYLRATGQTKLLEADGDDYTARIDQGIGMLEWYGLQVHPKEDTWFKPVQVEIPFQVPITGPDGKPLRCYALRTDTGGIFEDQSEGPRACGQVHKFGAIVTYDGRIDMIVQDLFNGGYFLWDHKSAATMLTSDRLLELDPQVNGYTWAAYSILGIDIRGFLYVEYRKDYPKPPRILAKSYKGRRFSTDKQAPTDLENFTRTVQKYDLPAYRSGVYDEYIAWLQSPEAPKFHQRFSIIKTKQNLEAVGNQIYLIAKDMISQDLSIYPNAGRFSCTGCAYFTPCHAMFMGEDYQHSLNSSPFKKV